MPLTCCKQVKVGVGGQDPETIMVPAEGLNPSPRKIKDTQRKILISKEFSAHHVQEYLVVSQRLNQGQYTAYLK